MSKGTRRFVPSFSRKRFRLILTLALILSATGAFFYFLWLPDFRVTELTITGVHTLESTPLEAHIRSHMSGEIFLLIPKDSIFFVNIAKLEKDLLGAFPRVANTEAIKVFPSKLEIKIEERKLWGIFCATGREEQEVLQDTQEMKKKDEASAEECAYIDASGFGYEAAPSASGNLIMKVTSDREAIQIPGVLVDPLYMEEFSRAKKEAEGVGIELIGFTLFSRVPSEFHVNAKEGFMIFLKRGGDYKNAFTVLQKVLEREIKGKRNQLEYMDLRFGNKVFYKYK